jgi:hypothetical protein
LQIAPTFSDINHHPVLCAQILQVRVLVHSWTAATEYHQLGVL